MGLFDQLGAMAKGAIAEQLAANGPALLNSVLAKTNMGNLQGIVTQLQQGGLGSQVQSWLSNNANMAVTPQQIQTALGSEQVKQIAAQLGLPLDAALKVLAEHLPTAVDQASPNGTLQK